MKTIIAVSRDVIDHALVSKAILDSGFKITEVVSGGANGVDYLGEKWARENKIPLKIVNADWNMYGKAAGSIRNSLMAKYAEALICAAANR